MVKFKPTWENLLIYSNWMSMKDHSKNAHLMYQKSPAGNLLMIVGTHLITEADIPINVEDVKFVK